MSLPLLQINSGCMSVGARGFFSAGLIKCENWYAHELCGSVTVSHEPVQHLRRCVMCHFSVLPHSKWCRKQSWVQVSSITALLVPSRRRATLLGIGLVLPKFWRTSSLLIMVFTLTSCFFPTLPTTNRFKCSCISTLKSSSLFLGRSGANTGLLGLPLSVGCCQWVSAGLCRARFFFLCS